MERRGRGICVVEAQAQGDRHRDRHGLQGYGGTSSSLEMHGIDDLLGDFDRTLR